MYENLSLSQVISKNIYLVIYKLLKIENNERDIRYNFHRNTHLNWLHLNSIILNCKWYRKYAVHCTLYTC